MNNPLWFNIILQWKEMGKGEYGVTFPFLIGAIARVNKIEIDHEMIDQVFQDIMDRPILGHYSEVRWCMNIGEPVISISKNERLKEVAIKSHFSASETDAVSLAFTSDLMGMLSLNCSTREECLRKLKKRTFNEAAQGKFSKNQGSFTPFNDGDIEFIQSVVQLSR